MKNFLLCCLLLAVSTASFAGNDPDILSGHSRVDGYADISIVKKRMSQSPLHRIEGIWQFPDDGAIIAIERPSASETSRDGAAHYRMVILRSPVRSVLPGTIMGTISPSAKKNHYSARVFTDSDGGSRLLKPKNFTFVIEDDSRLIFKSNGDLKWRIYPWRLFPYIYKLGVRVSKQSSSPIEGCIKIYPNDAIAPQEPFYL